MNFRPSPKKKPELNLIPLIDVLIVLLIFLVLTTTFSREGAMRVNLPQAGGQVENDKGIELAIGADGSYRINNHRLVNNQMDTLKKALREAAGDNKDPLLTISAYKSAQHQYVLSAMDAAQQLGFVHVTFRHVVAQP